MNKSQKINVSVDIYDLYSILLGECRYGYSRNNHLMPHHAYEEVKKYLPLMFAKDPKVALGTACQICEECISDELFSRYFDGLDDEHGNRSEAIEFIKWCIDWMHANGDSSYKDFYPSNYYLYEENIEKAENFKYRVYELETFEVGSAKIRELTTEPVTGKEADQVLFVKELGTKQVVMNRIDIKTEKYPVRVIGEIMRIIEPAEFAGKIYSIELVK